MNEYPRMLYRGSFLDTLTVGTPEEESEARADGWMSLAELKEAQAAPPPKPRGRRARTPEEPDDADSGEGPPDQ